MEVGVVRIERKEVNIDALSSVFGKNLREILGITLQDSVPCVEKQEASSTPSLSVPYHPQLA